ncbi:MAG TPA: SRPBCC family protein [Acidimicrobiales bacterium]
MSTFHLTQEVAAPVATVWADLANLASHVEWMADAASITFVGDRRQGVGTRFDCVTRVGPLRTVDRMEVTRWDEGNELAVRHQGLVRGEGTFTLRPLGDDRTELAWREDLRFPWWLGGPVAGLAAAPVLRRLWRGNLVRFAERFAGG